MGRRERFMLRVVTGFGKHALLGILPIDTSIALGMSTLRAASSRLDFLLPQLLFHPFHFLPPFLRYSRGLVVIHGSRLQTLLPRARQLYTTAIALRQ